MEKNKELFEAVKQGELQKVMDILERGIDVNERDENGNTALLYACEYCNLEIVEELLKRGADVSIKNNDGRTALIGVVSFPYFEDKKLEIVRTLIKNGIVVEEGDNGNKRYKTALIIACEKNNLEIVKELLKEGADANMLDQFNCSPLMYACKNANLEMAKELIKKGANVNERDNYGVTPLMMSCKRHSLEIVKELIKQGASINEEDKYYAHTPLIEACLSQNLEIVEELIKNGADVNRKNKLGDTALIKMCSNSNNASSSYLKIVHKLIEHGANVNEKNNLGYTPLREASCSNNEKSVEVVNELLKQGANINEKDDEGMTPLISNIRMQGGLHSYWAGMRGVRQTEAYRNMWREQTKRAREKAKILIKNGACLSCDIYESEIKDKTCDVVQLKEAIQNKLKEILLEMVEEDKEYEFVGKSLEHYYERLNIKDEYKKENKDMDVILGKLDEASRHVEMLKQVLGVEKQKQNKLELKKDLKEINSITTEEKLDEIVQSIATKRNISLINTDLYMRSEELVKELKQQLNTINNLLNSIKAFETKIELDHKQLIFTVIDVYKPKDANQKDKGKDLI